MAKFIAKLMHMFFGPNSQADSRHMAEVIRQQHDPLARFINQKPSTHVHYRELELRGEAFPSVKGDIKVVFGPKPTPAFAPTASKKQAILNYIKLNSAKGITAEGVARAFPSWTRSTVSARVSELYKSGLIVSVGTANTGSGSLASLFAVAKN